MDKRSSAVPTFNPSRQDSEVASYMNILSITGPVRSETLKSSGRSRKMCNDVNNEDCEVLNSRRSNKTRTNLRLASNVALLDASTCAICVTWEDERYPSTKVIKQLIMTSATSGWVPITVTHHSDMLDDVLTISDMN